MKLTTLVIDDSKIQKLLTCKLVNEHPNLDCIGAFDDSIEGLEAARTLQPDVLILDVEMPNLDGFGILRHLEHDCQVILYSTRSEFALSAFQYDQVKDYLTKPIARPRFEQSVEKILIKHSMQTKVYNLGTYAWSERLSKAS